MALIADALAQGLVNRAAYIEKYLGDAVAGGTTFFARVTTSEDPSVELPMGQALHDIDLAITAADYRAHLLDGVVTSLLAHLVRQPETGETKAVYADIDAFLAARAWRVPVYFSTIHYRATGSYLDVGNVYDDVIELGVLTMSGSGAGTFSDEDAEAYDSVHCGGNQVEAYVPTGSSATSINITVSLTKPDATSEDKTITVNGAAGTTVAIGSASDIYTAVTAVTVNSGGAQGQLVNFRTKLDRAMAL